MYGHPGIRRPPFAGMAVSSRSRFSPGRAYKFLVSAFLFWFAFLFVVTDSFAVEGSDDYLASWWDGSAYVTSRSTAQSNISDPWLAAHPGCALGAWAFSSGNGDTAFWYQPVTPPCGGKSSLGVTGYCGAPHAQNGSGGQFQQPYGGDSCVVGLEDPPPVTSEEHCATLAGGQFQGTPGVYVDSFCSSDTGHSCTMEAVNTISVDAVGATVVQFTGQYEFTGTVCGGNASTPAPSPAVDTNGCIIGATESLCISEHPTNCGTVNGVNVCTTGIPSGACISTPNGGAICGADAPNQPDDGVAGQTVAPEFTINNNNGSTTGGSTYNYYSAQQLNISSVAGTTDIAPEGTQLCGGSGQEACETEEVPADFDPDLGESGLQELTDGLGTFSVPTGPTEPTASMFGLTPSGTCNTLPGVTIMGASFAATDFCFAVESVRDIMSWVLAIFTIIYIWSVWMRAK